MFAGFDSLGTFECILADAEVVRHPRVVEGTRVSMRSTRLAGAPAMDRGDEAGTGGWSTASNRQMRSRYQIGADRRTIDANEKKLTIVGVSHMANGMKCVRREVLRIRLFVIVNVDREKSRNW